MDKRLEQVIELSWKHFVNNRNIKISTKDITENSKDNYKDKENWDLVPSKSIPILWFGDTEAYKKSPTKVMTVALNPSNWEFKDKKNSDYSFIRFKDGVKIYDKEELTISDKMILEGTLNNYFKDEPYRWFKDFEKVLNFNDASYYTNSGYLNTAIHTDIYTPLATDPTWGKLSNNELKTKLESDGLKIWRELIEIFRPDVIYVSINSKTLENVFGFNTDEYKKEFKYKMRGYIREYHNNGIKIITGINRAGQPFAGLSSDFMRQAFIEIKNKN